MLSGGASQLFHAPLQVANLTGLGYPFYLLNIIGVCKIIGAIILLLPRFPVLKTVTYAGLFFIVTSAAVSYAVHGDLTGAIPPFVVAIITVISYRLNPQLSPVTTAGVSDTGNVSDSSEKNNRAQNIAWWTVIIVLEFVLISGGAGEIFHLWGTVEGTVNQLGYPLYFLTIIGVWKILGAIALLYPGFPRLQQWAYAGIFFHFAGAATSVLASGRLSGFHVIITLIFAGLTIAAWMLQRSFKKEPSTPLKLSLQY
jgi:uncharacterized membrane protein